MGGGYRVHVGGDGLASHEPAVVTGLAEARIPADLPPAASVDRALTTGCPQARTRGPGRGLIAASSWARRRFAAGEASLVPRRQPCRVLPFVPESFRRPVVS